MIDQRKAVFLPADKRVLNLFKGYILNEELLTISEEDLYEQEDYYEDNNQPFSIAEKVVRGILIIPLIFLVPIILIFGAIFKRYEETKDGVLDIFNKFLGLIFKKKKVLKSRQVKKSKYEGAILEDIPDFLHHCRYNLATVYLYCYQTLSIEDQAKVKNLMDSRLINSCHTINKLSDMAPLLAKENISIHNSLIIIKTADEKHEARLLGFNPESLPERNVQLLHERNFEGEGELEWNSQQTIRELKGKIDYYLKGKSSAFLSENLVLLIEDNVDEFLKDYILKNLDSLRQRMNQVGMQLIYFPSFQLANVEVQESIVDFVRYRNPVFYSLSDNELNEVLQLILKRITPQEFYTMILKELELPYFKRPSLLRKISRTYDDKNKFTYAPIIYRTEEDLDWFFYWYFDLLKNAGKRDQPQYRMVKPPDEYDADWHFGTEGQQLSDELKQKIDAYKDEGKYGALVEAIMYMLETIKEEKPEIIDKVKPLLEKRKLLESKVVLSPLVIDKHYNILLPAYGNQEVKMHALPKTVYLLFLRYPNGIRFKELYRHKAELLEIYNKVTNKYEKEEIQRAIDDLVDMTKPSINQKCARIREAFRTIMDEHIAKHYYIDGMNGEPKCIALPPELITMQK